MLAYQVKNLNRALEIIEALAASSPHAGKKSALNLALTDLRELREQLGYIAKNYTMTMTNPPPCLPKVECLDFSADAESEEIDIDTLFEWEDNYDGDLPDLDPDDYDDDDELDDADYERRRQYWRLTGRVATSEAAWLRAVEAAAGDADEAEAVSDRFRALCPDLWPIDCHLSYERGDGHVDDSDSIEGAGHYSIS